MNPELTMQYVHSDRIGYGRLGVALSQALTEQGVDVYDGQRIPDQGVRIGQSARDQAMDADKRIKDTNAICWVSAPSHAYHGWLRGQYAAMFTMYETTWLPESFREHLHNFDLLIVPSDQNVELFSQYHPNVKRVLLGVDPERWHFTERPPVDRYFRFLIGGSGARKGGDLVQRAFLAAFPVDPPDGPSPRLVIKSPRGNDDILSPARTEFVSGYLSADEEVELYSTVHCYVQPSRGEGFGLQPLQAIAQGVPTILTDAHGHASFAHLGYGIGSTLVKSPSSAFLHGDHPEMRWWEPDFDELVDRMRHVYDHYDQALEVGRRGASGVELGFTWRHSAAQFQTAMGHDTLRTPYQGDGSWVTPSEKLYPVVTVRDWKADIGGKMYFFKRGELYYESADVKRSMFDAGRLDPVCYDPSDGTDLGLLPEQVAAAGVTSGAHSYCPECSQRLNTRPTKADDMLAELEGASV